MARILIAEDDDNVTSLLDLTLSKRQHVVSNAANGLEALRSCRRERYDLVIIDIRLPHLNGLKLAGQLINEDLLGQSALMFLTALPATHHAAQARTVGADAYALKPFRPTELADVVDLLIATRASPSRQPWRPTAVETHLTDTGWRNRFVDGHTVDGTRRILQEAARAGKAIADRWAVPHIIAE